MFWSFTNHSNNSFSSNNFTWLTDFFYWCSYFHRNISINNYNCCGSIVFLVPRNVMRHLVRSYGESSTVTLSPSISLIKFFFILPLRYHWIILHQNSSGNWTSNTRPGRAFVITHSTSILPSLLDIDFISFSTKSSGIIYIYIEKQMFFWTFFFFIYFPLFPWLYFGYFSMQ